MLRTHARDVVPTRHPTVGKKASWARRGTVPAPWRKHEYPEKRCSLSAEAGVAALGSLLAEALTAEHPYDDAYGPGHRFEGEPALLAPRSAPPVVLH
jgi:hypothetical protein